MLRFKVEQFALKLLQINTPYLYPLKNWVSNQITGLERIRTWDLLVAKSGCILWAVDSSNDCGKDASFVTVPLSATLSDVWSDQEIKAWHDYPSAC